MNDKNYYIKILGELRTELNDSALDNAFNAILKRLNGPQEPVKGKKASTIQIFSDGACRGNPGPGAWACFARDIHGHQLFEKTGVEMPSTNNKMEMKGVLEGLKELIELKVNKEEIEFFTDSKYVINGILDWMPGWKRRGWKKADKKVPENLEIWQEIDQVVQSFPKLKLTWVKGHSGHAENERCDQLANEALDDAGF